MEWIHLADVRDVTNGDFCEHGTKPSIYMKFKGFHDNLRNCLLVKKESV